MLIIIIFVNNSAISWSEKKMFSAFGPFVIDVHCAPISDVNDPHSTNQVSEFLDLFRHAHKLYAEEREFEPGTCGSHLS